MLKTDINDHGRSKTVKNVEKTLAKNAGGNGTKQKEILNKIATIILFYLKIISLIIAKILIILVFVFLTQKLNYKQKKCEHSKCSRGHFL